MKTSTRLVVTIVCAGAILALAQSPIASGNLPVPNSAGFSQGMEIVTRVVAANP